MSNDQTITSVGFVASLVLALICLIGGGVYLILYYQDAGAAVKTIMTEKIDGGDDKSIAAIKIMAIHARNIQARLSLQACGVFVGMAFGFLGFSLFLLGIKNEMAVEAGMKGATIKATSLLPGVAVIIAATVLVWASVTHSTPYSFTTPYLPDYPYQDLKKKDTVPQETVPVPQPYKATTAHKGPPG